jgi:glycerophosphoryl diester phosphodiesterase
MSLAMMLAACASPPATYSAPEGFDVQGHRGARGLLPENTLPAFARALELGVTTLELDVGMTRDGVVVLGHDPYLDPAVCLGPGGGRIEGERGPLLRDLDAAAVRAYDCGSLNPDPVAFPEPPRANRPGTPMPTLDEVLQLVAAHGAATRLNVEIKATPVSIAGRPQTLPLEQMVDATLSSLRRADALEHTTLQSFHWRALALAKRREPRLRTTALVSPHNLDPAWLDGLDPAAFPDFLALLRAAPYVDDVSPWWRMLVPGEFALGVEVRAFQEAGYRVVPWTVNDAETMRAMLALGVDGLISDYPDRLLEEVLRAGLPVASPAASERAPPHAR